MKTHYKIGGFVSMLLLTLNSSFAQEDAFTRDFEGVKKEMMAWDAVRGEWLANSMQAVINNKPIPDRNFPEDYTPAEMFQAMPMATQTAVRQKIATNSQNTTNDEATRNQWTRLNHFATRPSCSPQTGRTYGDPHLKSFDGSTFSFQTVGEFTLVKSKSGHMNVQVRQKASGESVSLNSAVAMDVAGDRLCIYASDLPDANSTTPVRLEGQALYVEDKAYFLPHGGTVVRSRRNYLVTWPTGERVEVDMTGTSFMNVTTLIYPCNDQYDGVLGDGDGDRSDDFRVPNSVFANNNNWDFNVFGSTDPNTREVEQQYLTYVARDFGNYWRINDETTLFDYPIGRNTNSFTDYTFPRQHISVRDMDNDQRERARRNCQAAGLTGADLNACIFDNGMLNIPPSPQPVISSNPTPITTPVRKPVPNVNPGPPVPPTPRGRAPQKDVPVDINNGNGGVPRGDGSTSGGSKPDKDPVINAPSKDPGTTSTSAGSTTDPVKDPGTGTTKPTSTTTPSKPVDGPPIEPETPKKKKPFVTWSSGSSDNGNTTTPTRTEPSSSGSGSGSGSSSGGSTTTPTRNSGNSGGSTTSPTRSSGGSTTTPTRSSGGGGTTTTPTRSSGGGTTTTPTKSSGGVSTPVRVGKGG